jgi:hypothetical protein
VAGAVLSGVPEAALGAVGMRPAIEGLVSGVKTAARAYKTASERFGTPARPSPFTLSETPGWGTPPQQPPAPATTPRPSSPTQPSGGFGATSVGAAQTPLPVVYQQALQNSSPQLQRMVSTLPADQLNPTALDRHIQADSLGIQLTEGQGTGDAVKISRERNMRGANPELVQRFNEQNERLKELLPELREQLTPTATIPDTTAAGEGLIAAYQALDDSRVQGIRAAYRRLIDMNNGVFPIDQQTMLQNARARLSQNLKSEFLPDAIDRQIRMFEEGQPMNFEQFEALRTNLSNVMRGTDGNASAAARIVRESMEELPLRQTASQAGQQYALEIKNAADEARLLARQRFSDLDTDKAYASVVNGNARMNTFIRKFVVNAAPEDLQQLALKFGDNLGSEVIRAGVLNHLQDVSISSGTFRQSAFNKALKQMEANRTLSLLFGEEGADRLRTIGNVAQFTQEQPVGSFVNNSNSTTAAIATYGVNGIAKAIDGITRIPIASTIVDKAVSNYQTGKALEPFAGLKNRTAPGMTPKGRGQRGAITLEGVSKPEVKAGAPTLGQLPEGQKLGQTLIGKKQRGSVEISKAKQDPMLISSQRYLDPEIIAEKQKNKDYVVTISPAFEANGETMQVVIDGHHSLAAAKKDKVKPKFVIAKKQNDDRIGLLEKSVDDYLESNYMDSDWYDVKSGDTVF